MKHIFIVLLALLWIPAFSQARMGNTLEQLKTEFPTGEQGLNQGYTTFTVRYGENRVIYFLEKNRCSATGIYPSDQAGIKYYVQIYNSKYTILSTTRWRAYLENAIFEIELFYQEG